jgi:hypothetical protein
VLVDKLIDDHYKKLVSYMIHEYDEADTPCIEYEDMVSYLGIGTQDEEGEENDCQNEIQKLY